MSSPAKLGPESRWWQPVWTTLRYELLHLSRDLLSLLVVAVLLPLLLAPFVSSSFARVQRQLDNVGKAVYSITLSGPGVDGVRTLLHDSRQFREISSSDSPGEALRHGICDVYVSSLPRAAEPESAHSSRFQPASLTRKLPETPLVTIYYTGSQERSKGAALALNSFFTRQLRSIRDDSLRRSGLDPAELFTIREVNLTSSEEEVEQTAAVMLPVLLTFILFGTGSVTALDSVAGERERGSLATLLITSMTRMQITVAKWLTVSLVSLAFGLLQAGGFALTQRSLLSTLISQTSPLGWAECVLVGLLLNAQIAAVLLWISVRSATFKQAQLLYMPALLTASALAAVSWLQELSLSSVVALVPVSGLALAFRDAMLGQAHPLAFALALLAGGGWVVFWLRSVAAHLTLDTAGADGSQDVAEAARARLGGDIGWFYGLLGAAMVTLPGNFPILAGLRGQVLVNQGCMLVVPFLLLRAYGQPVRRSLRLRSPGWHNWITALLAAPLLHLGANSVAIISSWLLPMSEQMVRDMTRLLLPESASTPELLVLIALAPAVCEELAFRGALLAAVQKPGDSRRPSLPTCLLVGIAFGAFHFSLQRLLPTATIGCVLTWVALRTGSIFPCMVLHFVNNALALLLEPLHVDYLAFPGWSWLALWAVLLGVLSRFRPAASRSFPPPHQGSAGVRQQVAETELPSTEEMPQT